MASSNKPPFLTLKIVLPVFILLNVLIFFYASSRPIVWQQSEMTFHNFFWSQDKIDSFTLHSGLTKEDFIKILDGDFRTRHLSNTLEMVSAKFWQFFETASLHDFTLIGIHVGNVVLLWFLILSITKNKTASWFAALLLLNAGASLSTLLFPFRHAKVLVMTFLLVAWLIIAASKGSFFEVSRARLFSFFFVVLLALFTDELTFFIFPLLFFYMAIRDGAAGLLNKRMLRACVLLLVSYFFLTALFFIATIKSGYPAGMEMYKQQLSPYLAYFKSFSTVSDIFRAFFCYFLRRNFGYWDPSLWGVLAILSSGLLLYFSVKHKHALAQYYLGAAILVIVGFKALFFPHLFGYHHTIMPPGTKFPCLLFFSWYYVYCDTVFVSLLLGLFLTKITAGQKTMITTFCLITLINFSNAYHLKNGPQDALVFHGWGRDMENENRKIVKNVLDIKKTLIQNKRVYLSFPSGDNNPYQMSMMDQPNLYASLIPVMYLRSFEQGKAVMSLENVRTPAVFQKNHELTASDIFYDVPSATHFDLKYIKANMGIFSLDPAEISNRIGQKTIRLEPKDSLEKIVFFLKARAGFILKANNNIIQGEQSYGQSYQIFNLSFRGETFASPVSVELTVYPTEGNHPVYLVGPFVFAK